MSVSGFADIHSHFVYGIDDGAQTQADMYTMLDAAHKDGITVLYATPHVIPGYKPFSSSLFQEHFDQAIAYCASKQYELEIYPGAELLYTPSMRRHIDEQRLITMGASEHVLVEFSAQTSYSEMSDAITSMEQAGYIPILAHIERYDCLFNNRSLLRLKESHNMRCQINANTILSKQGFIRNYIINSWFKNKLVDYVASDAHNTTSRPFRMRQAESVLKKNYSPDYVMRLLGEGSFLSCISDQL